MGGKYICLFREARLNIAVDFIGRDLQKTLKSVLAAFIQQDIGAHDIRMDKRIR